MIRKNHRACVVTLSAVLGLAVTPAGAADLTYQPRNPSFGGNPNFGLQMLNNAQSQNPTSSPQERARARVRTQGQRLQQALEREVTRLLVRSLRTEIGIFDEEGALQPGTFIGTDFRVDIVEEGDTLIITTEDLITGDLTEFEIQR